MTELEQWAADVRPQFPALARCDDGQPRVYLDNPAGTQVPQAVLDHVEEYLVSHNANAGGVFRTSEATDAILQDAHAGMADLLNAASPDEIIFGPNMTTLTFALSRSLGEWIKPGAELVVTRLDHDANVAPWLRLAETTGATIRWLDFDPENGTLNLEALPGLLNERTFLVAVGYASNLLGTINPVATIVEQAHQAGALVFVDAVHYVPHGPVDVQALGADFLACSPYKFFGPHQGVLWGRGELLDRLPPWKVRPADERSPGKFETGTQNHEAQAGVVGALDYLESIGRKWGGPHAAAFPGLAGRRLNLHVAMQAIQAYEQELSRHFLEQLGTVPDLTIHGLTDPRRLPERAPTFAFTHRTLSPEALARLFAAQNIFTWHGHSYAVEVVNHLKLPEGVLRAGAVHYNTKAEIDRLVETLKTQAG